MAFDRLIDLNIFPCPANLSVDALKARKKGQSGKMRKKPNHKQAASQAFNYRVS